MDRGTAISMKNLHIPKNMHLNEQDQSLEFNYSWFKYKYLVAAILTPLFAYFLIDSDYVQGSFSELTLPVMMIAGVSVIVEYYGLAKIFNSTRIFVSLNHIEVKSRPLPFNKNLSLDRKNVAQLYVAKHRIGDRNYLYSTTYQINVILVNQEIITLVKGLETVEQGRFIEQKIEIFFGIKDVSVEGEVEKNDDYRP